jgi:hypothetical protein
MSKVTGRKKRVIITTAAMLAIGGGAAFAYWSASGTGTGAASAGTNVNFTVASSTATGGALTPGGPTQAVAFTVTNPGTGVQILNNVNVTVANPTGTAWTAVSGCSSADFTVGTPVITYGQIAPGGNIAGTVTVTMNNLSSNQDSCKNVTVPLYIAAS